MKIHPITQRMLSLTVLCAATLTLLASPGLASQAHAAANESETAAASQTNAGDPADSGK